jgi:hypothetical protein
VYSEIGEGKGEQIELGTSFFKELGQVHTPLSLTFQGENHMLTLFSTHAFQVLNFS